MAEFFGLTGFLITVISIVLLAILFLKKKALKIPLTLAGIGIIFIFIAFALEDPASTEVASDEKEAPVEETQEEKDAAAELAKEQEEKKEAEEKADAEKAKATEKEYYVNEIQTKVDTQMNMFDEAWSTFWIPTFEGISDGTVDRYEAYENMKSLEQRYETLRSSLPAIEADGLSKENQETFDAFIEKMRSASWWRIEGAKKAQDMFDRAEYNPSEMDDITSDISIGDDEMMQAITSLAILNQKLGIEAE